MKSVLVNRSNDRGRRALGAAAAFVVIGLAGCSETGDAESDDGSSQATYDDKLGGQVVAHYADGVYAGYQRSLGSATAMDKAVSAFLAAPSEVSLTKAKDAWLTARDDYGLTEAFRFYGGPIDNEETGPEGFINGWPLDEAFIDYVEGDPNAGIINDPEKYPTIDADLLAELNEKGGETNISTGWHAIEFLLWGQDLSAAGPGARPATDYTTAPNAERRGQYLQAVSDLMIEDLTEVNDAWAPRADNYRAEFEAQPTGESLAKIITGIGELSRGELAGERMSVAYEARSQEDEHSCFSDNTVADLVANARSIQNVWTGTYPGEGGTPLTGPGVQALVESVDAETAEATTDQIAISVSEIEAIPAPFDQHLAEGVSDSTPGRQKIVASIESLGEQADLIVSSADELGVDIEVS